MPLSPHIAPERTKACAHAFAVTVAEAELSLAGVEVTYITSHVYAGEFRVLAMVADIGPLMSAGWQVVAPRASLVVRRQVAPNVELDVILSPTAAQVAA